jgi:N-acyl-D-aspartate/D-glutamate deacylase
MAPSVYASYDEYRALVLAMSSTGRGTVGVVHGETLTYEAMGRLSIESGRPFTSAVIVDEQGPGSHLPKLSIIASLQKAGAQLWPQVSPRPFVLQFSLTQPNFFSHVAPGTIKGAAFLDDLFAELLNHPTVEARVQLLGEPAFREAFRARTSSEGWSYLWDNTVVTECPGRPELTDRRLGDLARESGAHAADVLLDLGAASRLTVVFALVYMNGDEQELARVLKIAGVHIGVTDGGAHVAELCDAGYPSHVLGRWVRERKTFTLEQAVAMMSSQNASLYGLRDRGTLKAGFAADIVVFDPDTINAGALRRVHDLPGGAPRLVSDATGVDHVINSGTHMISEGQVLSPQLPGRLLRSSGQ